MSYHMSNEELRECIKDINKMIKECGTITERKTLLENHLAILLEVQGIRANMITMNKSFRD